MERKISILDPERLRLYAPVLHVEGIHLEALLDAARIVWASPELTEAVERDRALAFDTDKGWDGTIPEGAPALYPALVLAAQLPYLKEIYKARAISDAVLADTLDDYGRWIVHAWEHGEGHSLSQFPWLTLHFSGKLFRLGRLHFVAETGRAPAVGFLSQDGRPVLFAPDGNEYKKDGWAQNSFRTHEDDAWTARLTVNESEITGHMLGADGRADPNPVTLSAADYTLFYKPGDPVLEIHIPSGSPLSPDAVSDSLARAGIFYSTHFPEFSPRAFQCSSWLLGPCLEEMLPETSAIVQFSRHFSHITIPSDDGQFWERIFDFTPVTFETAPRNTSLQRAFLDRIASGKPICGGCGVIPY